MSSVEVRVLQGNSKETDQIEDRQTHTHIHTHRDLLIYFKELPYVVMGTGKSKIRRQVDVAVDARCRADDAAALRQNSFFFRKTSVLFLRSFK